MKKFVKPFLLLAVVFMGLNVAAQTKKQVIAINYFDDDDVEITDEVYVGVTEAVKRAFVKSGRFKVIDKTKRNYVESERESQKKESYMASQKEIKDLGADYVLAGKFISLTMNKSTERNSKGELVTYYKVEVVCDINLLDVSSGEIKTTDSIKQSDSSTSGYKQAMADVVRRIELKVDKFIQKNLPVELLIVEILKTKKNQASSILIAGGTGMGIKKGNKLKVMLKSIVNVGGKKIERKKEIGKLSVTKVDGENFSQCKVVKGGEAIKAALEKDPNSLVCITLKDGMGKSLMKGIGNF